MYFEVDADRAAAAQCRQDIETTDATRLKGMPASLTSEYTRHLRHYGVDIMSGTGGVVSAVHTERDVVESAVAFEKTVCALYDLSLVNRVGG